MFDQKYFFTYTWRSILDLQKRNSIPVPEKAAQVMTLTAFIWLKEENKVDQGPRFLSLGAGILFRNYSFSLVIKNSYYIDYFFLLLENGSPSPFFLFAFFFSQVCLFSDSFFSLSMLFYIIRGFTLQAAFSGRQKGQREGKLEYFSPSLSQVAFLATAFSYLLHGSISGEIPCSSRLYWVTPLEPSALECSWLPAIVKSLAYPSLSSSSSQLLLHQNNQLP